MFVGRAKILIARSIARVVYLALSHMWRQMSTRSLMYPSTQPWRGRLRYILLGRAGTNSVFWDCMISAGIVSGCGWVACVFLMFQNGLLVMLLAKLVNKSINTQHATGLKEPPNMRRR